MSWSCFRRMLRVRVSTENWAVSAAQWAVSAGSWRHWPLPSSAQTRPENVSKSRGPIKHALRNTAEKQQKHQEVASEMLCSAYIPSWVDISISTQLFSVLRRCPWRAPVSLEELLKKSRKTSIPCRDSIYNFVVLCWEPKVDVLMKSRENKAAEVFDEDIWREIVKEINGSKHNILGRQWGWVGDRIFPHSLELPDSWYSETQSQRRC